MQKLDALLKSKSSAGVEFNFQSGGSIAIHCAILRKEKNSVQLASGSVAAEIKNLKEIIPSDAPVFISINGKGIIHKKISVSENDTDKTLLHKVLPNAGENEFYIQKSKAGGNEIFVSIIRKETADNILRDLAAIGLHVAGCSLGPFSVNSILPLMNGDNSLYDLKFSGHKLSVVDGKINLFELMDTNGAGERIKVGADEIPGSQLISFASALQYFVGDQAMANIPFVKNAKEDYRQKRIFKTAGASALVFFFILLLANYFLFTSFSNSYNELNQKVQMNTNLLAGFEKMRTEISDKEKFLEQTGLLDPSKTSYYADQVAVDLPLSIQLTQLNIYPLVRKNMADDNDLSFTSHSIQIKGNSDKSTELNEWIKILRQKNWVKNVSVLNYSQDASKKTGDFNIEVTIK